LWAEFVAKERQQDDLPQTGLGLGAADADTAVGEIDVAPAQVAQLAGPRSGEEQRGDDRPAVVREPALVAVEPAGRLQQSRDLLDRVQMHRSGPLHPEASSAARRRVLGDVAVLDCHREHPLQRVDRLVDRRRRERS
jgi:hypothetical protein